MYRPTMDENIIKVLKDQGPLQIKFILAYLQARNLIVNYDSLRVYICTLKRNGKIFGSKFNTRGPMYYGNPEWLDEQGKFKEFNPDWDKKLIETK